MVGILAVAVLNFNDCICPGITTGNGFAADVEANISAVGLGAAINLSEGIGAAARLVEETSALPINSPGTIGVVAALVATAEATEC